MLVVVDIPILGVLVLARCFRGGGRIVRRAMTRGWHSSHHCWIRQRDCFQNASWHPVQTRVHDARDATVLGRQTLGASDPALPKIDPVRIALRLRSDEARLPSA